MAAVNEVTDATAPQKNVSTSQPPERNASPRRSSASRWPRWVTFPVACETTTAHRMNRMTFVYPATHDNEIASRDFCRNE